MEEIYKNLSLENLEGEIWLPVVGFEGLYEISSLGRVKSLKFDKEKILRQVKNKDGYLCVTLFKNGKMKTFLVHRLAATAFLENPNGYRCVNHKNEIKTDNRVENLEWCDDKYNLNYKNAQARRVASIDWKAIAEKLTNGVLSKKVYQYDKDGNLIKIWDSTAECGRQGFHQGHVASCCRGELKTHKGFKWSYTELKKQD